MDCPSACPQKGQGKGSPALTGGSNPFIARAANECEANVRGREAERGPHPRGHLNNLATCAAREETQAAPPPAVPAEALHNGALDPACLGAASRRFYCGKEGTDIKHEAQRLRDQSSNVCVVCGVILQRSRGRSVPQSWMATHARTAPATDAKDEGPCLATVSSCNEGGCRMRPVACHAQTHTQTEVWRRLGGTHHVSATWSRPACIALRGHIRSRLLGLFAVLGLLTRCFRGRAHRLSVLRLHLTCL